MNASVTVAYLVAALAVWSIARALHGLVIARRSTSWKLAVAVVGLGLGTAPALHGRPLGYVAVALGALASGS